MEYKWTKLEIDVITTSIVVVKLSNKKPHETFKTPELIQGLIEI